MSQHAVVIEEPIHGARDEAPITPLVNELQALVRRGRRRWQALILLEAAGLAVATPLTCLWVVFLLDNLVHLTVWGRLIANVAFLFVIATLALRLRRRWCSAHFTEDQVALAIERRTTPGVQNQLINSLQLSRDGGKGTMIRTVIEENCRRLRQVSLRPAAACGSATVRTVAAALLIAAGAAYWIFGQAHFANAASRIFLPFADIAPIYRTILRVEPGDMSATIGSDVTITIEIKGQVPDRLRVLTDHGDKQELTAMPVDPGTRRLSHTFKSVRRSFAYAVRGGDFTSRYYRVKVPLPWELMGVAAILDFPEYTHLPDGEMVSPAGELEALIGTWATVIFSFNQPTDEVSMLLRKVGDGAVDTGSWEADAERITMERIGPARFTGRFEFRDVTGYCLESTTSEAETVQTRPYTLRATADQPPHLHVTGLDYQSQIMIDAIVPLKLSSKDDYGLNEAGLFYRASSNRDVSETSAPDSGSGGEGWQAIRTWTVPDQAASFASEHPFALGTLDVVEGEMIEVAARARDTDPLKNGRWTTGPRHEILVSSVGAALQLLYERILRTESELRRLLAGQQIQVERATEWIRKLGPLSGLMWDEEENLDALNGAMGEQAAGQAELRKNGFRIARKMVDQVGSLRMSVNMLAQSEMQRCIQMLESVPKQENPQRKRARLSDARMTHERVTRSLGEIIGRYVQFRRQWEMSHMVPFTRMLAERQERMAESSAKYGDMADSVGEVQKRSTSRRQRKLLELAGLAHTAFAGMAERENLVGPILAAAFRAASLELYGPELVEPMQSAGRLLGAGSWHEAESAQRRAAGILAAIYRDLRKAQVLAAQQALAALQELAKTDVEAQKELEKLKRGSGENLFDFDPDQMELDEIIHLRKTVDRLRKKQRPDGGDSPMELELTEAMKDALGRQFSGERQKVSSLKLATNPSGQMSVPSVSDLQGNRVRPVIQAAFEDLVGDLLEEADALRAQYETYNLNTAWIMNESGEINRQGGYLNSTSAAAATGNMKPHTQNVGGASRMGRQGARSHGYAVGSVLINRRGRDQVQEGQFEVPDQMGLMKEILSGDPQKDTSTGIGGKRIAAEQTSFNVNDAGEWRDDIADRLGAPQAVNQIVERHGTPLDPRVAARMYDLRSTHEQIIQRIKAVRKQLDNLYLPTDHLDDIMQQMSANLDRLKDRPDPEVFRRQIEQLDRLKSTVIVFGRPASQYGQGLRRDQTIDRPILDEPAWPALPGYEEAVKAYYKNLSGL